MSTERRLSNSTLEPLAPRTAEVPQASRIGGFNRLRRGSRTRFDSGTGQPGRLLLAVPGSCGLQVASLIEHDLGEEAAVHGRGKSLGVGSSAGPLRNPSARRGTASL